VKRALSDRLEAVGRLLEAARTVHEDRSRIAPLLVRATGLTPEGVELGFASLEVDATEDELRELISGAGEAEHVHVILSANVFVAPLRALAIARAAADRVTLRPSMRDPVLARALVEASHDEAIAIVGERDIATVASGEIHVYGRDETIAEVRVRARPGVLVRGHGAGMGVAFVTAAADLAAAADLLADDVLPFDQRGCLSPRVAIVEGNADRAHSFARTLDECLRGRGRRVPRGELAGDEREEARRWLDTMAFAGRVWEGDHHAVALGAAGAVPLVPPGGRHVYVTPEPELRSSLLHQMGIARFVVAAGADDPGRVREIVPHHVRVSRLGRMQRPPLDGPVDRRSF
jgi:acyl-CoA reductase LuxC